MVYGPELGKVMENQTENHNVLSHDFYTITKKLSLPFQSKIKTIPGFIFVDVYDQSMIECHACACGVDDRLLSFDP